MIEKTLYTCQYCFTDYKNKEKALQCEENHKSLDQATMTGIYKSKVSISDGCPTKIRIRFQGMDKSIEYWR